MIMLPARTLTWDQQALQKSLEKVERPKAIDVAQPEANYRAELRKGEREARPEIQYLTWDQRLLIEAEKRVGRPAANVSQEETNQIVQGYKQQDYNSVKQLQEERQKVQQKANKAANATGYTNSEASAGEWIVMVTAVFGVGFTVGVIAANGNVGGGLFCGFLLVVFVFGRGGEPPKEKSNGSYDAYVMNHFGGVRP
jgi:hypothetical protein